jgi:hypothetical protein
MTAVPRRTDIGHVNVKTAAPAERLPRTGRRLAGLPLSIAGVAVLMGSITGEALHPGPYTTHADTLSHLGASEPPSSVVVQPTAESSTARCSSRAP